MNASMKNQCVCEKKASYSCGCSCEKNDPCKEVCGDMVSDPCGKRDALLLKISKAQFAAHELALYLNSHPHDDLAKEDYLCYATTLARLVALYEETYGPLFNMGMSRTPTGCWVNSPWPWQIQ